MGQPLSFLDHLGTLAVLCMRGGRPDVAETLIDLKRGVEGGLVIGRSLVPSVVNELMLVKTSFEEATSVWLSRN